jgi:hypothetical protein
LQGPSLGGIHDGRFTVLVAIILNGPLILYGCLKVDDRIVAFAVVVSKNPHQDLVLSTSFLTAGSGSSGAATNPLAKSCVNRARVINLTTKPSL